MKLLRLPGRAVAVAANVYIRRLCRQVAGRQTLHLCRERGRRRRRPLSPRKGPTADIREGRELYYLR